MLTKITLNKLIDTPTVGDKKPSHSLVASGDKYENKTVIGALWLRKGQNGNFLSGELKKPQSKDGKDYDGYVIITTKEYNSLKSTKVEPQGYTGEVTNLDDINF